MTTSPSPLLTRLSALAAGVALLAASCAGSDGEARAGTADAEAGAGAGAGAGTDADSTTGDAADHDHETADGAAEPTVSIAAGSSDFLGDYTLIDETFGTDVTVTVADGLRTIVSNALPNHETGEFPNSGNPNAISEQSLSFSFTTDPVYTGTASFAQMPGVALNGVTFEPGTAETATCTSGETYRIEALQDLVDLGLDVNNAHVQPGGKYHYHGLSDLLVDAFNAGDDLVLVGFAADGHLMYASLSNSYRSSYALRTDSRAGTGCLHSGPGGVTLDLEGTTPDGTYSSDWVYTEGSGDLDECNGTTINGQYAYVVTNEYPYVPRCLMGESAAGAVGPSGVPPVGDGADAATPGGPPDMSEAAAALGVTETELLAILPPPGQPLDDAAAQLGVSVEELMALLPPPPGP